MYNPDDIYRHANDGCFKTPRVTIEIADIIQSIGYYKKPWLETEHFLEGVRKFIEEKLGGILKFVVVDFIGSAWKISDRDFFNEIIKPVMAKHFTEVDAFEYVEEN